jgi:ferritin-like metal-binding protein YciE/pimeloyl-ACP methyl ester carboxylesterase
MVCLHGFLDTWRTWELVLPALERRHDVLAPTLAGHAGGPPIGGITDTVLADAVERAMDEAGFETAHLVGNSLGGHVALQLAARGRAATVVALAPAGGWAAGNESYREALVLQARMRDAMKAAAPHARALLSTLEGRRRATQYVVTNFEHIPAELIAHQMLAVAGCDAASHLIDHALRARWTLDAEHVTCPVRIVWGTADRLLPWPSSASRFRTDWLPHADWVELDGIGHCPQLDVPLETAQLILGHTSSNRVARQRVVPRYPSPPGGSVPDRPIEEQLTKYLTDVHSIELQALAQLEKAPDIAGDPALAEAFRKHLSETRDQEELVRAQLEAHGAGPSTLKDIAGRVGGWAMVVFARLNPDTPGKLAAHAFAYEHMELAAYELLARVARRAGDDAVVEMAQRIGAQEQAMGERLAAGFDAAVDASLRAKGAEDLEAELVSYLRDAHAIEGQALQLLEAGPTIAGFDALAGVFAEHLEETRGHRELVTERLKAHDSGPSRFQSTALRVGGLNVGGFFAAQPDTPVKLAGFAYAFEHLEIAAYELLRRVAERAGDHETVAAAERILAEERTAAERAAATWDAAVDAVLGGAPVN